MSRERRANNDVQWRQQRTEEVLDAIEAAIELDLGMAAIADLPEGFRDPIKAFARGCELLDSGLSFHSLVQSDSSASDDDEFRMVARNGSAIAEHIKQRMHAERQKVEAQMLLDFDESP